MLYVCSYCVFTWDERAAGACVAIKELTHPAIESPMGTVQELRRPIIGFVMVGSTRTSSV